MKSNIPKWVLGDHETPKEFRREKRRAVRFLLSNLDDLMLGSAYLPPECYRKAKLVRDSLYFLKANLTTRKWGR